VAIVGAGLTGLACARRLTEAGAACRIFEASDGVGGRIRTDRREGFLLDRGFQVFLESYPEARRVLDYARLDLRPFEPGALVRVGGGFYRISDPFRNPLRALRTLRSPVGTLGDKLRVLRLRHRARSGELFSGDETTTLEALRRLGFSQGMIDAFFFPFLGGIFLDPSLETSSYLMDFVLRWMSEGDVSLPARGMGAIPEQLAGGLPAGTVWLDSRVRRVSPAGVRSPAAVELDGGARIEARTVVMATGEPDAVEGLVGGRSELPNPGSKAATCLYFSAQEPPLEGPWLVLSGEREDLVRNLAVLDRVAPGYAPPGSHLVSATVLTGPPKHGAGTGAREEKHSPAKDEEEAALRDDLLEAAVRRQLVDWFGNQVDLWERVAIYRIPHALPAQPPGFRARRQLGPCWADGLFLAGDWLESGSIEGALRSGRRAAEAVLESLRA